jgi:glycosyltransferase involved in cell wall biosynthesis
VVLNGVDLERFRPAPRTFWLHDHLDLPHQARLVGMPAIFARWKGHLQVVEAFERAAGRLDDVHLVLVGGAIYDTTAERGFAEELVRRVSRSSLPGGASSRLTNRIHFVRHQSEPWRLYPELDVVVHFSTRPEPFGRVVAEALASGVPPIAARAGGPTEIVDYGITGWLVTPGDVPGLADAIVHGLEVMARPDADAMRGACRRAAESRFAADRYAAEVAAVLRAAAGPPAT